MLDLVNNIFGRIEVTEADGVITVSGLRASVVDRDIQRAFDTSRIAKHLFHVTGMHSFSFYSFFAVDVLYILEKLIAAPRVNTSRQSLRSAIAKLKMHTWLRKVDSEARNRIDRSKLSALNVKLLDHQEELLDAYQVATGQYGLNGFLFAGAAGSGKTIGSLGLSLALGYTTTIIVCPLPSINLVWEQTIKSRFVKKQDYFLSTGNTELTGKESFIVVHYEYLEKLRSKLSLLRGQSPMVILDESHNFNDMKSLRTQAFLSLCTDLKTRDVLLLSGTPFKAMASETIPLLRAIDPLFTKGAEEVFLRIYKGNNTGATEILRNRLGLIRFKVEKNELKLEPPIVHTISVKVPGSDKYTLKSIAGDMRKFVMERKLYYAARREEDMEFFYSVLEEYAEGRTQAELQEFYAYKMALEHLIEVGSMSAPEEVVICNRFEKNVIMPTLSSDIRKQFADVKTIAKYTNLRIIGECLSVVLSGARIACHVDMSKHFDILSIVDSTEKKTVVFTSFVDVVTQLDERCHAMGLSSAMVYGATNKDLNGILARYTSDKNVNPLIATYASLSTAVPLVMSDTVVVIDVPFRPHVLDQSISRVWRLGSDTQTHVWYLELDTGGEANISSRSFEIMTWAATQVTELTGVEAPFTLEETKIEVEEVEKLFISGGNMLPTTQRPAYLTW